MHELILICFLFFTTSTLKAAEKYGEISFHSSMVSEHVSSLKNDLRYLFHSSNLESDSEFLRLTGLEIASGPSMHNWLVNRVKFIVGEQFDVNQVRQVQPGHLYPATPLPVLEARPATPATPGTSVVVMSNVGASQYYNGKRRKELYSFDFDGEKVEILSPRVGLIKVGEGLFLRRRFINPDINSPANAIMRIGTLFHEARHSDGNGLSTSFFHVYCPEGHSYARTAACERVANGPYTIGALTQRQLLKNCSRCSASERTALEMKVIDSFSRILHLSLNDEVLALEARISQLQGLIKSYKETQQKTEELQREIKKLELEVLDLQRELYAVRNRVSPMPVADAEPDGQWQLISLQDSLRSMITPEPGQ